MTLLNREGICPNCMSMGELEYGDSYISSEGDLEYPWDCLSCKTRGIEIYKIQFIKHRVEKEK